MNNATTGTVVTMGCLFIILVLMIGPFLLITGVNILLKSMDMVTIPVTLKTLFGAFLILLPFSSKTSVSKK
jgi:hypothetical protein